MILSEDYLYLIKLFYTFKRLYTAKQQFWKALHLHKQSYILLNKV